MAATATDTVLTDPPASSSSDTTTSTSNSRQQNRLSSLHITLPFSVVQVWNELEVGQVVKLPATDQEDGDMSLHAQRDGSNNISLRFIHKSLAAVADAYAADINIRKVALSKLDSSSIPVKFACKPIVPPANEAVVVTPSTGNAQGSQSETTGQNVAETAQDATRPEADVSKGHTEHEPTSQEHAVPRQEPVASEGHHEPIQPEGVQNLSRGPSPTLALKVPTTQPNLQEDEEAIPRVSPKPLEGQLAEHPAPVMSAQPQVAQVSPSIPLPNANLTSPNPNTEPTLPKPQIPYIPVVSTQQQMLTSISTSSVIRPINIAPVIPYPTSQAIPITIAPVTPVSAMSSLKRSYPMDRSQGPAVFPGNMSSDLVNGQHTPPQQDENSIGNKKDRESPTNGLAPSCKKKRGPRQYKCDICGAEFVYAGVFSKHMWKHNRYSKTSPTPEMPPSMMNHVAASLQQGISRNSMVNILSQHQQHNSSRSSAPMPLDMSSQSKLASHIPQYTAAGLSSSALHLAGSKPPTQVPPNVSNTSLDLKKNENGGVGYMHDDDMADDAGLYDDDSLAEVHMEKKDGAGYDCWICGRPFHYRPPFIRHMRGAHEIRVVFDEGRASNKTGKIFTCKLCSQSFLYQLPFEKHMKLIHGASMESISSKMVDIRDQRDMAREFAKDIQQNIHIPTPVARGMTDSAAAGKPRIDSPIKAEAKIPHEDPLVDSPLQKMSMVAKCDALTLKNSLISPLSATSVAQSITSSLPSSMLSSMCSQSTNGPSSLLDTASAKNQKDGDYILIDSSGNHVMFGDKLQCFVCSEQFTDKRLYLVHMQNEHGIQPKEENSPFKAVGTKTGKVFNCHLCQRRFSYKGPYEKHMRSHGINLVVLEKEVTQESLYCEICGKVFAYQLPYEKHMRNVHNIGTPMKSTTQQLFYRQDHRQTHQCEICFRTFATMQSLVKHVVNKHQTQLMGTNPLPGPESYFSGLKSDSNGSSHENSMELPTMPENENGSEAEDLPQRVYLDPHSVLKDLSSILPPEDDDEEAAADLIRLPSKRSEAEPAADPDCPEPAVGDGQPGEDELPRVEPTRVHDPGSMLSMIKCEICNKMFRYKIAFMKHIQQVHGEQVDMDVDEKCDTDSDQINNNNKLELNTDYHNNDCMAGQMLHDQMNEDEAMADASDYNTHNHMPTDECEDMPVDYSKKSPSEVEQQSTVPPPVSVDNNIVERSSPLPTTPSETVVQEN